jgi:alkanesulfonate monooxygenase SsuD/methylene tetrahydromethanopterin reductase-like flavin-dependent oxidoreductase (luciferase family)
VQFGLFIELSVPRPWGPNAEKRAYDQALEQIRLADELGFDQVWAVEHHFLEEYSHCSSPEILLTAAAMQTTRIRLCHGIVVCVPQYNHPIRVAERAATLDIISGGRVEVGTGRSASWTELAGFQADPDETKKTWDEYVRVLPRMWTEERFSHQGRCFSMPERAVLPKPLQKPHPPLWVAVTSPGTELDAAERGLGHLGLTLGGIGSQEERIAAYRRRIQSCEPVGAFVNDAVNAVNFLYCDEDDARAQRRGERIAGAFSAAAARFMDVKEYYASPHYSTPGLLASIRRDMDAPDAARRTPEGLVFGNPARVIETLRRWESIGVDRPTRQCWPACASSLPR